MKIKDLLNKLFPNMEEEIDMTSETSSNLYIDEDKSMEEKTTLLDNSSEDKEETREEVKEMFKIPTFKDGYFDLESTDNEELKAVLKTANDYNTEQANSALINSALNDKIAGLKLHRGITKDAVITLLDKSNISVKDGKVTGVDEAFDALKSAQAGLFVSKKEVESNPVLEGFDPAKGGTANTAPNSFAEAFSMMEGI